MKTLIVNQSAVAQLLPMRECIAVMEQTLTALARGDAVQPLRSVLRLPGDGNVLGMMPAYLAHPAAAGIKVITVFPGNQSAGYESHQGAVLLFEMQNGRLLSINDASAITAIRTSAVSAVATKLLARPDAGDLAILGSGTQAHGHLEAMLIARSIRRVRVWSRTLDHARAFAAHASRQHAIAVEVMETAQQAAAGADIICTVTAAREPILRGEWIAPGAHINAVGSSIRATRELDTRAVVQSRLFVDRRESTVNEAGDFLFPKQEGALGDEHIRGEIGEILAGRIAGRVASDEITLFKSLGLAVEDVASAHHIFLRAQERGLGDWVEFGGARDSAG
ncbi:MAG: ornithine cyclodeaminase family protein [Chloroflexi bacterium]|nr:ornithine cyclodeaminase family protein [Chloroflexota bacterium]